MNTIVTRFILVVGSLAWAITYFITRPIYSETITGHVIESLAYGYAPAIFAIGIAGAKFGIQRLRTKPVNFSADVNLIWGVLLAFLVGAAVVRYSTTGALT